MQLVAPQETGTRLSKTTIFQVVAPAGTEVLHLYTSLRTCSEASRVRMRDVMSGIPVGEVVVLSSGNLERNQGQNV
jgi:hypothetical protein